MKTVNKLRVVWLVALILVLAGMLLSVKTFRQLADADKKINGKLANIDMMKKSASDLSVYIAAKESYQLIPGAHPVKFESIFNLPGVVAAKNIRESELPLEDDWFILRREVVIDDCELDALMTVIKKAEAQRPPWKLSSCNVKSSSVAPGHARVVLVFEALEQRL